MKSENFKAYLAWTSVCFFWGTTYLAIRIGVSHLPPLLFAGFRWIIAGTIFVSLLKWNGKALPKFKDIKHLAVVGICLIGIGNGLVVFGEQYIPSGIAALFITTLPFWVIGIESFLPTGPKLNYKIILGLLLGILGVFLIFEGDFQNLISEGNFIGVVCLLLAVVSWASGTTYSKYKKVDVHPLMGAAVQMLIAGVLQTVVGIALGELPGFSFDQNSFLAFSYLVIFGSLFGYGAYIYAIAHLPLSFVATYAYVNPVIALILGWLVLDENLNFQILLSAAIIFIGVAVVRSGSYKRKKKIPLEKTS